MPWKVTSVMEQRKQFITEYLCGTDSFKALCQKFGISEKTGHKWKNRFLEFGFSGLADQSKAPSNSPNQLDEDTVIRLIKMRSAHPAWGPKKLAVLYKSAYPESPTPSESSIYRILGKAGLIPKLRFRLRPNASNCVISWKLFNPMMSGPLISAGGCPEPVFHTVRDLHSRYILTIRLMERTTADAVKAVFEELFYHYGLPKIIRSDNGTPFAS